MNGTKLLALAFIFGCGVLALFMGRDYWFAWLGYTRVAVPSHHMEWAAPSKPNLGPLRSARFN